MSYRRTREPGKVDVAAVSGVGAPPDIADQVAVWWAQDLEVVEGANVTSWVDRVSSIGLIQSELGKYPVMSEDGLNGKSAVYFDGVDDQLYYGDALSVSQRGCVIMVAATQEPSNAAVAWAGGNDSSSTVYNMGSIPMGPSSTYHFMDYYNRNGGSLSRVRGSSVVVDTTAIFEWSSNSSVTSMRVNNTLESLTVVNGSNSGGWFADANTNNFTLGGWNYGTPTYHWKGHIAFCMVADTPLSASDRSTLYDWISGYYGISVS